MKEIKTYTLNGSKRHYTNIGDYVDCEISFEDISKELNSKLYDKISRSLMSKRKKEKRDKETHMVDVA